MQPTEGDLVALAMRHGGVLSRAQLIAAGLSRRGIEQAVHDSTLHRLRRNAYVPARVLDTARADQSRLRTMNAAAALTGMRTRDAVVSHASAALIHGIDLLDPPAHEVTLTVPPGREGAGGDGIRQYGAALPARHVIRVRGIPVTTPARTAVDLARAHGFAAGLVAMDSALHRLLTRWIEIDQVLGDCRRWPGIAQARRAFRYVDEKAESALESLSRARFIDSDLPPPETQAMMFDLPTPRRVDFLWREQRVIGEADGLTKYRDPDVIADEKQRDELFRQAGYELVHWVWQEIRHTPEMVIGRIRAAFERTHRLGRW
jgi:very-short-patch-repair endonuclease